MKGKSDHRADGHYDFEKSQYVCRVCNMWAGYSTRTGQWFHADEA